MARVVVYERAVDAVLTDVTFYDKLNQPLNGIKIKEEPLDRDTSKPADSSSVSTKTDAVRLTSPALKDRLSNSLNNKENESAPAKGGRADPETNKSNLGKDGRKCKRDSSSKSTGVENSQPLKRARSYTRYGRAVADYKRKRNPETTIECDVCLLSFWAQRRLKCHKAAYNRLYKCCCDTCSSVFTSESSFSKHKKCCARGQQPENGRYHCYFCKRKFRTKKSLQAHLFHLHGDAILSPKIAVDETQSKADLTETTTSPVADVRAEQTPEKLKDSPCNSPAKKMRQTTLTEFLSLFGKHNDNIEKQGCVSPRKSDAATNQGQAALDNHANPLPCDEATTAKATESSASATPTANRSVARKRPFVQIHVDTDMMMSLLNTKIKTEPEDFCTPTVSQSTSYNLRRPRTEPTQPLIGQNSVSSPVQRRITRTTESDQRDTVSWERQMRSKFGCTECVVRLERCDLTSNSEKADEPQAIPLQEDALNAEGNSEIDESARNPCTSNLEESLVVANEDATNSEVREPETALKGTHESKDSDKENEHKTFQCKVCKKSFSSKENIREHMELFHVAYISSVCSARYTSMSQLLNHYLRQHTVFKRKQCCVCYEKFDTRMLLKQHMSLHCIKVIRPKKDNMPIDVETVCNVFKKQYQCRGCSKRFWLNSCFQQHQKVCRQARNRRKNAAFPSKKREADTVDSSAAHVSRDSERACEREISDVAVEQKSCDDLDSSSPDGCSAAAPQGKTSELRKVASQRRLVNGVARVKGYQIDVTGTDKEKFLCCVCGKQFNTFQNLCIHERTFCQISDNQCDVCGTSFTTKRMLQQHMLATHAPTCREDYKFFCKFCNQGFIKRANLQIHERHFHSDQSPMNPTHNEHTRNVNTVCTVCNLMFESYERFIEHNMYYYKGQIFTCTFCSQSFQGMYMLHHHNKLMHYPEGTRSAYTYTCDICNEGFNQESHFHAHKLHVHLHETSSAQNSLRTIQDQTCQDHSYALTTGNVTATDAAIARAPVMAYTCEVCSLSFTNQRDLFSHEMEYSDDGDFQCSKCSRRYPNATTLTKHHSLNHSGHDISMCYKCRSCGEVVTTSTAMVCHEKHFHTANNAERRSRCDVSDRSDVNQNTCRKTADQAGNETVDETANETGNLTCLTCSMRFEDETKLKDHLLEYSDIGDHQCEVCHRKFAELHRLEVHRIKHSRLNTMLNEHHCPICHEGFTSVANVRAHVLHLHGYETFSSVSTKRPCIPSNTNQNLIGEHRGHEIGSAVVNQTNGNDERVNGDPNGGAMCNGTQSDAVRETPSNTEEEQSTPVESTKPPDASVSPSADQTQIRAAKCPECGLVFKSSVTLAKHRLRFTSSGEYACKYCGCQFKKSKALNAHLLKHSVDFQLGLLKYECSYCGLKFRTPISVYSHVVHIHGKDKLKDKCIVTNRSGISNVVLEYSKSCGTGLLMGTVSNNDDLGIDHAHRSTTENVAASNQSGQQEISLSTATNSVNTLRSVRKAPKTVDKPLNLEERTPKSVQLVTEPEESIIAEPNSVEEKRDSESLREESLCYTCPVCSQKYGTLKKFQTHLQIWHSSIIPEMIEARQQSAHANTVDCIMCNFTFSNESELKEHMKRSHPPYPPTCQAVPQQLTSPSSLVDQDAVEIVWEKNSTITRSIECLSSQDSVILVDQPESLPPATAGTVHNEVGKLKVKSFARMVN